MKNHDFDESLIRYIRSLSVANRLLRHPLTDLDIKQMQGDWQGFYRLRIGKIRVLFTVEVSSGEIEIYSIGSRGDVYKNR